MIRVGVIGATGKMGREVCRAVHDAEDLDLVAAVSHASAGRPLSELMALEGCAVTASGELQSLVDAEVDVAVDFTGPTWAREHVDWYIGHGVHAVVGTTGFDLDPAWGTQHEVGVVVAPNFAIGAILMMRFAAQAARHLPDAEIVEYHHPGKLDAPSGTALSTAARIAGARAGEPADVPIHSVRMQGVVANQDVIFGGLGQTLTIRHVTTDRTCYMPGVLLAIRAVGSRPGLTVGLDALLDEP